MLNLRALRQENNLSQLQLSALIRVKPSDIAIWETNLAFPPIDKLLSLCDRLDTDISHMLSMPPMPKNAIDTICIPVFSLITSGVVRFETSLVASNISVGCFALLVENENFSPRMSIGDIAFYCPPKDLGEKDIVLFFDDSKKLSIDYLCNSSSKKIIGKMCELRSRL